MSRWPARGWAPGRGRLCKAEPMGSVTRSVVVDLAGLWHGPRAARRIDADAVADRPDPTRWLAVLDVRPDGRAGLVGRLETQLRLGEQVLVTGPERDGWLPVCAPGQPSTKDARGYPGWVRAAHVAAVVDPADPIDPAGPGTPTRDAFVAAARAYGGVGYLWGGLSRHAIDCSGLVHLALRDLGVRVPRDAHDQQAAARPVDPDEAEPGDLWFFARPGAPAHHVGIVTGRGRMLHAPQTGAVVVEEALTEDRRATRSGAGRVLVDRPRDHVGA